jgi:hypothetical protein
MVEGSDEEHPGIHTQGEVKREKVAFSAYVLFEVMHRCDVDQSDGHANFIDQEFLIVIWVDCEHTLTNKLIIFPI